MVEYAEKYMTYQYRLEGAGLEAIVTEIKISKFDPDSFVTIENGSFYDRFESMYGNAINDGLYAELLRLQNEIDHYVESNYLYVYTFDDVMPKYSMEIYYDSTGRSQYRGDSLSYTRRY